MEETRLEDVIPGDIWEFNGQEFEVMENKIRKDGCRVLVLGEVGQEAEDSLEAFEIGEAEISNFHALELPEGRLEQGSEIRTRFP